MQRAASRIVVVISIVTELSAVACGGGDSPVDRGSISMPGGAGAAGGGSRQPDESACAIGPHHAGDRVVSAGNRVVANVVNLDGGPAAFVECQLCGIDACLDIADTDEQGRVQLQGSAQLDSAAFKVGDGIAHVRVTRLLPTDVAEHEFRDVLAVGLIDTRLPFEVGAELSAEGVVLRFEHDGMGIVDGLTVSNVSERTFRVATVPANRVADMAPADLGLGALFGLGPLETRLCPPAQLTVANVPGWEPGTPVQFLLHGSDISEEWAPYGGWSPVSTGFVSDDGSTIATASGRGLPVLGLIGVRIAQ